METCSVSIYIYVSLAKDPGVSAKALYVYIPINQGKITATTHLYTDTALTSTDVNADVNLVFI